MCVCGGGRGEGGSRDETRGDGTWSELSHKYKCLLGLVEDEDSYAVEIRLWRLSQNCNHIMR